MNIAEVVAQVARAAPSRPAVTTGGRTASYAAFWDRTRRIAGALRTTHRLRAGDRVALCIENCGEFFEALFACWTAGLCAVPANAKLHAKKQQLSQAAQRVLLGLKSPEPTKDRLLAPAYSADMKSGRRRAFARADAPAEMRMHDQRGPKRESGGPDENQRDQNHRPAE